MSCSSGTSQGALPPWIRSRKLGLAELHPVKHRLRQSNLHTVCEEARCPNRSECFGRGTATFLINGRVCTRSCGYCAVPQGRPLPPDPAEPERLARMAADLALRHAVITSVDRDDLADGGAGQFKACIERLRALASPPSVEVLTPDFRGDTRQVELVAGAAPEVYNHNVETVPRLYRQVRRSGRYAWALQVIEQVARNHRAIITKSGLMVGLGEERDEVVEVMRQLAGAGCQVVTIGQYLQPSSRQVPVARYWHPDEFEDLAARGEALGLSVVAGPHVRSSYRAEEALSPSSQPAR